MGLRLRSCAVIRGLGCAVVLVAACSKRAPQTQAPAGDAGAAEVQPATLEQLEAELERNTRELSAPEGAKPEAAGDDASKSSGSERCERVCGLRESICGIAEQICALATDHEDEPRYTDACGRARGDCERASEVCDGCTP